MDTGYKVEWSTRAVNDFKRIIDYLTENWSEREIRKFVRQIDKNIDYISSSPFIFPSTSWYPELRRCVISKILTLYYLVRDKTIYLVTIRNNHQDSGKLKDILE